MQQTFAATGEWHPLLSHAENLLFGTQNCAGVGPHPETKCVCTSKIWMCEEAACPSVPRPDLVVANRCAVDGLVDLSSNDPRCPAIRPTAGHPSDGCLPALHGKSCRYGSLKRCGQCFPTSISTCDASGMWVSDVSYFPPREGCKFDLGLSGVEGMSCEEATSAIFAASSEYPEYPVTNVLCLKETDTLPSDDDLERYLVITDGNGAALKVVYNRATDCPAKSPLLTKNSPVPTQQCKGTCTYTYESFDVANATCETTDRCYCDGSGEWICESVFNCMSTFPVGSDAIMFSLCPDLSILARPVVEYPRKFCSTNEPCTFVYKSSIPEAMCENTDTCTCSGGDWDCRNVTECVADQKPFTIDCPAESPATSNTTVCDYAHQLSPCTFKYLSSVAVVLCENIDICICTSTNEWQCQRQIQCTDPSPAIACPAEPPAGDEVACDDEHQIQPCNYTYATTISGGTCQNTDFCVCGSLTGYWNCQNSLKCVNDTKGLI